MAAQMQPARARRPIDRRAAAVGLGLLLLAAVAAWDGSRVTLTAVYGMGPQAMAFVVAGGLALLAAGHFAVALRGGLPGDERGGARGDARAVLWIALGFAGLIALVGLGGGFIAAMAVLFAATARAFGRTAVAADLAIGFALGLLVFLMFTKLLTLSLPEGPLERLL